MQNERKETERKSDHVIPGVPGGNAQRDPAEQSHRRDMEDDDRNGPRDSYRGNLPPDTRADTERARPAAVPGKDDADRIADGDDGSSTRGGTIGKPV
jgi:hypothetical protein